MTSLSIILIVLGVGWGLLRWVMQINNGLRGGRSCITAAILPMLIAVFGAVYVSMEFVWNKGPDDWGAIFHAMHVPQEKYGPSESPEITIGNYDFVKDPGEQFSGTYHFRYRCAGQNGTVLVHYDKATGKFDHDEIVPDK